MGTLSPKIVEYGRKRLAAERESVPPDSTLISDGCWAHGRLSPEGMVVFICHENHRVIRVEIFESPQGGRKRITFKGTFKLSPQAMESAGLRTVVREEAARQREGREPLFARLVTDLQNAAPKIVEQEEWEVKLENDPGHVSRAWDRRFEDHEGYRLPQEKNRHLVLKELRGKLKSRFFAAMTMAGSDAERVQLYMAICDECVAPGSDWVHREDPHAGACLRQFLEASQGYVVLYQRRHSTNV
jgi:hypothetical protein